MQGWNLVRLNQIHENNAMIQMWIVLEPQLSSLNFQGETLEGCITRNGYGKCYGLQHLICIVMLNNEEVSVSASMHTNTHMHACMKTHTKPTLNPHIDEDDCPKRFLLWPWFFFYQFQLEHCFGLEIYGACVLGQRMIRLLAHMLWLAVLIGLMSFRWGIFWLVSWYCRTMESA